MPHADLGYLLNRVTRQMRLALAEALKEHDLSPQQAAALIAIAHGEDRLTPRAVAEAIDSDAATVSGLLDRLARDGWVALEPNPADGRSRLVVLTEKAARAVPDVMARAEAVSTEATACLSDQEVEELRRLLTRMCCPCEQAGAR